MLSDRSISSGKSREATVIKGKEATSLSQEMWGQDLSPTAQSQGKRYMEGDGITTQHITLPTGSP